jgi:hypothetical protein
MALPVWLLRSYWFFSGWKNVSVNEVLIVHILLLAKMAFPWF